MGPGSETYQSGNQPWDGSDSPSWKPARGCLTPTAMVNLLSPDNDSCWGWGVKATSMGLHARRGSALHSADEGNPLPTSPQGHVTGSTSQKHQGPAEYSELTA